MKFDVRLLNYSEKELLAQVVELADANRSSLGFMAEQALEDYTYSGQIIVAVLEAQILGYLLFRRVPSKHRLAIAHLCIGKEHRGLKVPEGLFDFLLRNEAHGASSILLKCRREYKHATRMWERLKFVPRGEVPGRGQERKPLTYWQYDLGVPDLFSKTSTEDRMKVVVDANVLYDLRTEPTESRIPEAHALLADWVADEIALCVTDEVMHEINRCPDTALRTATRRYAERNLLELRYDESQRNEILKVLKSFIQRPETERNESDLKHVANAIAAGARYFITQDAPVTAHADRIAEEYGLLVRRPVDIIVALDQLRSADKYRQIRFVEHSIRHTAIKADELNDIAVEFVNHRCEEKKNELRGKLRQMLGKPDEYSAQVWGADKIRFAALLVQRIADETIEVDLLRCKRDNLRLLERVVKELIDKAARSGAKHLLVTDQFLSEQTENTLSAYRFSKNPVNNYWHRLTLRQSASINEVSIALEPYLSQIVGFTPPLHSVFAAGDQSTSALYQAERSLWPAKLEEANTPCFIIPIQERWARQLFDEQISKADLFGYAHSLLFSQRNVYYRAARPSLPREARILWYVSRSKDFTGICAASYVDTVTVGSARRLFRKYEAIGTYKWQDINHLAKANPEAPIMAFEFSDTECFDERLSLTRIHEIFVAHGRKPNPFAGPTQIDHKLFLDLYRAAH